jgi:hypothetical protein
MTLQQVLIAHLAQLGMALCLAGILLRGRNRYCRFFTIYLGACLAGNLAGVLWPERFFTRDWWVIRQTTYGVLHLAIALELVYWTFIALPGANQAVKRALALVLGATFLSLLLLPDGAATFESIRSVLQPRLLNGTIWLFAATVGISLLYRVPVHPWHQAIMTGFAAYLTVFTVLLRLLTVTDWNVDMLDVLNALDPLAYVGLLGYWTWAAWRTDPVPAVATEVLETLQPWRV